MSHTVTHHDIAVSAYYEWERSGSPVDNIFIRTLNWFDGKDQLLRHGWLPETDQE